MSDNKYIIDKDSLDTITAIGKKLEGIGPKNNNGTIPTGIGVYTEMVPTLSFETPGTYLPFTKVLSNSALYLYQLLVYVPEENNNLNWINYITQLCGKRPKYIQISDSSTNVRHLPFTNSTNYYSTTAFFHQSDVETDAALDSKLYPTTASLTYRVFPSQFIEIPLDTDFFGVYLGINSGQLFNYSKGGGVKIEFFDENKNRIPFSNTNNAVIKFRTGPTDIVSATFVDGLVYTPILKNFTEILQTFNNKQDKVLKCFGLIRNTISGKTFYETNTEHNLQKLGLKNKDQIKFVFVAKRNSGHTYNPIPQYILSGRYNNSEAYFRFLEINGHSITENYFSSQFDFTHPYATTLDSNLQSEFGLIINPWVGTEVSEGLGDDNLIQNADVVFILYEV